MHTQAHTHRHTHASTHTSTQPPPPTPAMGKEKWSNLEKWIDLSLGSKPVTDGQNRVGEGDEHDDDGSLEPVGALQGA